MLENKRILITGGTGSLGKTLVRRILSGEMGVPKKVIVFSRDETKQHYMRLEYMQKQVSTDEVIYNRLDQILEFVIGDIRDFSSIASVLMKTDVAFNAAALKQVPTCEYFPVQAVYTNVTGPENITRAIEELNLPVEIVVGISTDKACKPVNVMGITKALQERIFIQANLRSPQTRYICVRYGNVLASRGSVIPLFQDQIKKGGPVTITSPEMTRFLLSLDQAVDIIFEALVSAKRGETYIPKAPSARVIDIASAMIGNRKIEMVYSGVRPGEKMHEVLISEEELHRTIARGNYYVILPILPELRTQKIEHLEMEREYSSADSLLSPDQIRELLIENQLTLDHSVGE